MGSSTAKVKRDASTSAKGLEVAEDEDMPTQHGERANADIIHPSLDSSLLSLD